MTRRRLGLSPQLLIFNAPATVLWEMQEAFSARTGRGARFSILASIRQYKHAVAHVILYRHSSRLIQIGSNILKSAVFGFRTQHTFDRDPQAFDNRRHHFLRPGRDPGGRQW